MATEQAAYVLGVHPTASAADVERMYAWRIATTSPDDTHQREALWRARETLLGRSRSRTGAIVGWAVGGAAGLVILIVIVALVATSVFRVVESETTDRAAGVPGQSQVFDDVTVQYSGTGWTFILTSPRDCPAAKVVVGFSDTRDGDVIDQLTDTAPLQAGVPYTYTAEDNASTHPYAQIVEIVCHAM
ncbi:hypothetical protein GCM10027406_24670 [Leifsonia lichenia]